MPAESDAPRLRFTRLDGPEKGKISDLPGPVVRIGTGRGADLLFGPADAASVGPVHAKIIYRHGGFWLHDNPEDGCATLVNGKKIAVYVYNSQNATPDIQAQIDEAKAQGIPVTTITETMTPASASWQQWQTAQLSALRAALALATHR